MEPIVVDGGKGTVELGADGVIHLVWKPGIVLEAADTHAAMAAVTEVAGGQEYPMLVDMESVGAVTPQARAVFSLPCAASRVAFLGSGPVDRVLATFIVWASPPCSTRFFTSRDGALNWLLQSPQP